jgi:hypothetical protein
MRPGILPEPDQSQFANRISQLRIALASQDPAIIAQHTGMVYQSINAAQAEFYLSVWGQPVILSFPNLTGRELITGKELPLMLQGLLLYYLKTADGTPVSGRWISFSELHDGRFYNQAYMGYTGKELSRCFGNDLKGFVEIALHLGGTLQSNGSQPVPGDIACSFTALPRVQLLVAAWHGDEEFPSSFQVLFDASVNHYLSTDVCAILGSMLTRKLIAAYPTYRSASQGPFGTQP